jgi:hypothetical protein
MRAEYGNHQQSLRSLGRQVHGHIGRSQKGQQRRWLSLGEDTALLPQLGTS